MKKNILSLLFIALTTVLFTSCEKEEAVENCKICGVFITFNDSLTDEQITQYEAAGITDATEEYCDDNLIAFELDMADNGGTTTTDNGLYTTTTGCQ